MEVDTFLISTDQWHVFSNRGAYLGLLSIWSSFTGYSPKTEFSTAMKQKGTSVNKLNLWSGPSERQSVSKKASCAYMQSGRQPRPGPQHPSHRLAETSLGKHGAQPRQGQCQGQVSGLALTWALCSYTVPEVHVLVFSPAAFFWQSQLIFFSFTVWSRVPTRLHPTQFLSVLPWLP